MLLVCMSAAIQRFTNEIYGTTIATLIYSAEGVFADNDNFSSHISCVLLHKRNVHRDNGCIRNASSCFHRCALFDKEVVWIASFLKKPFQDLYQVCLVAAEHAGPLIRNCWVFWGTRGTPNIQYADTFGQFGLPVNGLSSHRRLCKWIRSQW